MQWSHGLLILLVVDIQRFGLRQGHVRKKFESTIDLFSAWL